MTFISSLRNDIGAEIQAEFGTEVARGVFDTYKIDTKYGRNSLINTGTTNVDVWNGGTIYTGHNCLTAQRLSLVSDNGTIMSAEFEYYEINV